MPIRNFFAFGNRATPQMPSNMGSKEKELLIKTRNTIFNALDPDRNQSRDDAVSQAPITDLRDAGMAAGDYSLFVNVFSKYIYSVERDKRTRVLIYREMSKYPEIAFAVDEYVDEAINENSDGEFAELKIRNDAIRENDNQRKTLLAEFDHLMYDVLQADKHIAQWFREYMIDGEIFFEKIIDNNDETRGIVKVKRLMTTRTYPIWKDIESDEILFFSYQADDASLLSLPREQIAYANSGRYDWSKEEDMKLCLSFLEETKTTYKRLKLLEDALVIYRIVRAPERRVFKIDVGNLPKGRADQFMTDMIKRYRQRKFFDPATGDVSEGLDAMAMTEDFWFPVFQGGRSSDVTTLPGGCLTLDTIIPLLDGRNIPLSQVIEEYNIGKQNWVYSCDPISGEIKPGKIDNAGITKKNARIMKLTLDNGQMVKCTPEHKFPVIGKGMILAKDIQINDSIIPLNKENRQYRNDRDYEYVYDNKSKKWTPTHKMVSSAIKGSPFYKEYTYKINENKSTIHHNNVNRFDNSPENIIHMGFKDHFKYHSEVLSQIGLSAIKNHDGNYKALKEWRDNLTPEKYEEYCEDISNGVSKYLNSLSSEERCQVYERFTKNLSGANAAMLHKMNTDYIFRNEVLTNRGKSISKSKSTISAKKKMSEQSKQMWNDATYRNKVIGKQKIKCSFDTFKVIVDTIDKQQDKSVSNIVNILSNNIIFAKKLANDNAGTHSNFRGITQSNIIKIISENGFRGWKHFRNEYKNINHRVISVEYLTETEDVGDLQIDNKHLVHNYHTYAIGAGIFVSNSGLGEVADLEYFRNKLYQGLKIPKSRFGEDQKFSIGDTQDITREEVKFVKEVKRFTERFSEVFKNIFLTHLRLKGIANEYGITEHDIKIHMFANNLFEKFLEAKVLELRFGNFGNFKELIDTKKPLFSRKWVVEKFLEISEEEWKKNQELLAAENMDKGGDEGGDGGGGGGGDLGGGLGGGGGDLGGDTGDAGGDTGEDAGGDTGAEAPAGGEAAL